MIKKMERFRDNNTLNLTLPVYFTSVAILANCACSKAMIEFNSGKFFKSHFEIPNYA